ncbi:MAG: NAD(P)/FAD-dependent oxidoreductase, partial [Clostridia bacterium]|nr:NAD(P)/FAD-dependent oxidoreductase [Clostridia bacterium]
MDMFDLVVIGSGAGLIVAEQAAEHGWRCALVERAKMGGTCLTKGCIPSKMLVYPADFIREAERAERFGVKAVRPGIDWETAAARMWEQIRFSDDIRRNFENMDHLTLYTGTASFKDPNTLVVRYDDGRADDIIRGSRIVIAAGARSFVPDIEGLEEAGYLTSERFFGTHFPDKPWPHLVLYGGGSISLEFAHIFSAYGSRVTIIERSDRVLKKEDEDISAFVTRKLSQNGVRIRTGETITSLQTVNGKKRVRVVNASGTYSDIDCDALFIASGIRSNADTLALDNAGVAADARGWIRTNAFLETSAPHIYALGDINGKFQMRHKANYEAQLLCDNLFANGERTPADYNAIPRAVFTCPQIAGVGCTE